MTDGIDFGEMDRRRKDRGEELRLVKVPDPEKLKTAKDVTAGATVDAIQALREPIDKMFARHTLTPVQYDAACRLRGTYDRAMGGGRSMDASGVSSGFGSRSVTEVQMDASRALEEAKKAVGHVAWVPLSWVVIDGHPVSILAGAYGWNEHRAKGRLDMALDMLVSHYDEKRG